MEQQLLNIAPKSLALAASAAFLAVFIAFILLFETGRWVKKPRHLLYVLLAETIVLLGALLLSPLKEPLAPKLNWINLLGLFLLSLFFASIILGTLIGIYEHLRTWLLKRKQNRKGTITILFLLLILPATNAQDYFFDSPLIKPGKGETIEETLLERDEHYWRITRMFSSHEGDYRVVDLFKPEETVAAPSICFVHVFEKGTDNNEYYRWTTEWYHCDQEGQRQRERTAPTYVDQDRLHFENPREVINNMKYSVDEGAIIRAFDKNKRSRRAPALEDFFPKRRYHQQRQP